MYQYRQYTLSIYTFFLSGYFTERKIQFSEGDISLSTELEPLLKDMVQLQSDILQLRDMVAKQQKVIQMLSRRQASEHRSIVL